ncbi:MAG: phosphatidate cytidylyltransferase [Sphaerochaetaceae bacterium]|nr:phosphatidate cytidylyltransferase [Sphaerochaetaceae bacterium]MDD4007285.1 phosphatidate cytidylyltransferase [Sphaerochaetaceae bacterium]MDD4396402.1 phosphatidate cytidylyltransferase [Sphaerochaetaceae bacterium]
MNNLSQRLLTTLIGVPAIVCLLIFLPAMNHLAFAIVAVAAAAIGSLEMGVLLFGKKKWFYCFPALLPVIQYLELYFEVPVRMTDIAFSMMILLSFVPQIFKGASDQYSSSLVSCSKNALLVFYPGYLITYVIRILAFNSGERTGGWLFLLMIMLVFSNDIFAYVFGRLWGKNNGGIVPVSPHKSIAGFAGGAICCILMSLGLCLWLFDYISVLDSILLGIAVSFTADVGDLIESLFKRSAGVKDSGNVIPGRGGMLDCLDSIIATVPLFYLLLELLA